VKAQYSASHNDWEEKVVFFIEYYIKMDYYDGEGYSIRIKQKTLPFPSGEENGTCMEN
jgi:hypothetical protein